jgi:uncharacterized membrane protein YhfC
MVSPAALLGLTLAALMSLAAPFVFYAVCRRRMTLPLRNIAIGAGMFVLFALVLESALHWYVLKHNPATAAWFAANPYGFAAYAAFAAALFEETGRYLAMRLLVKRVDDPGTAVSYGIGHGSIESILVGVSQAGAVVLARMLNMGTLNTLLANKLPAAAIAKIHDQLSGLDFPLALTGGVERICALLIQIALSLLVWRAVARKDLRWFWAAIFAHAGIDSLAALAQRGIVPMMVTESFVAAIGLGLLVFFLIKLPRRPART